ncbi:MAG: GIY-YIG nuclease family protein [Salinivirgaceae bacterium]|nr:GIY-YIG nuclease family protein [Salinivirgaceae bacterium]
MKIGFFCGMSKHFVYILYSQTSDSFYIGETFDVENRLAEHNSHFFTGAFTSRTNDWVVFLTLECKNRTQARMIESHIKKMKSKTYIRNLKKYPQILDKLLAKYDTPNC